MPNPGGLFQQPARWVEYSMYLQSEVSAKQKRDDEAEKAKARSQQAQYGSLT